MALFTTTDKIGSLKKKSEDALGVFRKTVADLSSVQDEIHKEEEIRINKIAELETEMAVLATQKKENSQFIDKINEFLGLI